MSKGLLDTYMYVLPTYRWPDKTVINTKCQQCFFLIKNTQCCGFKHSTMVYWQPSCWDVVLNVYWKCEICLTGSRSILPTPACHIGHYIVTSYSIHVATESINIGDRSLIYTHTLTLGITLRYSVLTFSLPGCKRGK